MLKRVAEFVLANKHMGFDEMAYNFIKVNGLEKDTYSAIKKDVKKVWNDNKLGWKMIPRTLLKVEEVGRGEHMLLEDFIFYIAEGISIVIPKGFITDSSHSK